MQALRFYDQRDIRLETVPDPEPGPGEVRLRVRAAGLSQTQVNEFIDGPFILNRSAHPLTGKALPLIPSQEFGGIIDQVGEGVEESWLGRQVAVLPQITCGTCAPCQQGTPQLCDQMAYVGLLGADGGFAEYAVVPASNVFPCPREDLLSFIEPLLVGSHVLGKIQKYATGQSVLVVGAGAVGCSIAAVCQYFGGLEVTLTDRLDTRLERACQIGLKTAAREVLGGPFDVVVDAAGSDLFAEDAALTQSVSLLRKGGTLLGVGTYFRPIPWVPAQQLVSEINLVTSFTYGPEDVARLDAIIRTLPESFEPLITRLPLQHIIQEGYYRAEVDKAGFIRLDVCISTP